MGKHTAWSAEGAELRIADCEAWKQGARSGGTGNAQRPGLSRILHRNMNILQKLPPFNTKTGNLNVVIDTPKGCRNKYAFDFKRKTYVLKTMLPRGAARCSLSISVRSLARKPMMAIHSMHWY
jgi:hypothetical protein